MSRQPAIAHRNNISSAKNSIGNLDVDVHKNNELKSGNTGSVDGYLVFRGICNLLGYAIFSIIRIKIEKCKKNI